MVCALFVQPVGCNTVFGNIVHVLRAYLNLKRLTLADDRRMQGLVSVGFWHCDIILETAFHRLPQGMNDSY